jgi:hypothetical protein
VVYVEMRRFRKRQVLFRMRVFLRLVKEKLLKNHAAGAFRAIWLKRRAMNQLADFTYLSKEARIHEA